MNTKAKALILIALLMLLFGAISGGESGAVPLFEDGPELIIDESVAPDFEALAIQTWDQFLTVFRTRKDCFGDVYLRADDTLSSRAAYDPNSATVAVRVPATAAMLKGALVHEWAHHLEFQCKEHEELRADFLFAQGLSGETPWRTGETPKRAASSWADMPSEQYAEATIVLVLGGRPIRTRARITSQAVDVIEKWAAGSLR